MAFHSSREIKIKWKPPQDCSTTSSTTSTISTSITTRSTTSISKSISQQVSESSSQTDTTNTQDFVPCESKPVVDTEEEEEEEEEEEFSGSEANNDRDLSSAHGSYSRLNIYSSEESDEDVCASKLKKSKSILDDLFTDESHDSASDSGDDLPSKPGDESAASGSEIIERPQLRPRIPRKSKLDGIAVIKTKKKEDGRRVYNKRHYCLFCSKPFSKIARHLEDIHSKEEEVSKACSFPKGSKERRTYLDELRLRGNYIHNIGVLKSGKGVLIPRKRPRGEMKASDFMHCPHCQGLFTKKVLWRHMKVCKLSPKDYVPKPGKNRVLSLCAEIPRNISPELWKILSVMVSDDITEAVKNDSCIIQMAEHWLKKSGDSPNSQCVIRQKLRELGKLLLSGRKVTSLKKLEDFIDPYNCMQAVEAVRHACEYNSEQNTYRIPSLAKKLAICLAQLSRFIRTKVVKPKNGKLAHKLQDFQKIHEERWNDLLCATVLRSSENEEVKFKPPLLLAFTEDVQKFHTFLNKAQDEFMTRLSAEASTKHWADLAKVALTQIILFNRSREVDVVSMTLETFVARDNSDPATDIDWALTEVEKQLCRHFYKIIIRREGTRPIPILLTLKMLRTLQLLMEKRESCGVMKDNNYVFARPSASSHFRCSDCVRKFALVCDAKDPQSLTCWKLRKQMATLSTVLNLGDPEINQLASFLGHDLILQDEFFPLQDRTLQLAKVHKVLTAMEQGRMMEFMGKNFADINVPSDEIVDLSKDKVKKSWECPVLNAVPALDVDVLPGTSPDKKVVQKKRKTWSKPEIEAVEKHMKDYITSCRVPGKAACLNCISAESLTLKKRDWQSVKFYIYNRIMALKRDASHKV